MDKKLVVRDLLFIGFIKSRLFIFFIFVASQLSLKGQQLVNSSVEFQEMQLKTGNG